MHRHSTCGLHDQSDSILYSKYLAVFYLLDSYLCRTGSVGTDGRLKNAITIGDYAIIKKSVFTDEVGMYIHSGGGWKMRLYRVNDGKCEFTRLLIHPDGNKPGTLGCLGIQGTDAPALRVELDKVLEEQGKIPVLVKREFISDAR